MRFLGYFYSKYIFSDFLCTLRALLNGDVSHHKRQPKFQCSISLQIRHLDSTSGVAGKYALDNIFCGYSVFGLGFGGRGDTPKMRWAMVSLVVGQYVYRGIVSFGSFS